MALECRRPAGGGAPRGHSAPLTVLAGVLLLPSVLAYSLTNCSVSYSDAKAVDCSQRQLTALPGDIPRDAVSLDLTLNMLSELKVIHFRDFLRLQVLIAATNNISRLEDGVFVHLVSLRELNLSNNGLRILTDNMFQGLSNLSLLKLSSNHIMHISPLSFKQLPNVKVVMVDFNALSGIEDVQPILELQHLEMLDITGNSLSSFRSDRLRLNVSSNLRALHISYNPMREFSITADAFPDLQAVVIRSYSNWIWEIPDASVLRTLTSLDLGETTLSFEDYQAILQSSDSVEELTLSWVKDWIDEGILDIACKVSSLRTLRLKWNSIDYVNDTLLQSCSQLTKLVLTLNGLNGLGGASLQSMTRLEILEMDYNSLSEVPVALRGLLALKILTLSNNGISGIRCADFFNLTQLTELHLENNHFSKLDACAFTKLNNLKVLNLRQNWLFTLGEAFKVALKNLEMLDLSGNCFVEIKEGAFGNLSSLKFLNLETEKIPYPNVAKAAFKSLGNLETLLVSISSTILDVYEGLTAIQNLSINIHYGQDKTLSTFGPSLSDASSSLKSLRIANYDKIREIKEIELLQVTKHLEHFTFERFSVPSLDRNTFKHTPQLKTLRMTQGEITVVNPELFQSIPNLEALDLSANRLKSLDFLAQVRFSRLSWLKVSQNQLSVVNESVFRFLPALTYLDMMDNPLNCDCSNSGFQRWLQSTNQTQVVNGHQLICTHPLSKDGSAFLDFDIHSCWMDISFLCYICTTCLTGVVLITSLTYNFLKWQVVYAYYLFLALLYDRRKWRKGAPQHYDAFISYNVHDEAWVHRELLPALEGEQGRRLCLHHRDFQPGKAIIDNITDAIYGSRKTICIISRHYLESEWCSREIQLASFRLFDEKKDVLILLFLEDLPARQLSPYYRMRWLMKRSSYLSWPVAGAAAGRQAVFWENVCRALDEGDAASDDSNLLTGP